MPPEAIFAAGATTLFATIVSILVLAGIFVLIAPMYGSSRDYRSALKVSTWGAVPVLLASATLVLPVMVMLTVVALLHTLYLYWVGVGGCSRCPPATRPSSSASRSRCSPACRRSPAPPRRRPGLF